MTTLFGSGVARWAARMAAAVALATLAACGGGGGGDSAGNGTLRVAMTDAPACGYDNVFVTVESVRVHKSGAAADSDSGWETITLSPPRRIDLLNLTNGVLEELGSTSLPSGTYSQVRLVLAENTGAAPFANAITLTGGGGALIALDTPSAQQSGLKVQANFTVGTGQLSDIVIDFDACNSVVKRGNTGRYNLKPVLRVGTRLNTSVEGFVTTTVALSSTTVSLQQAGTVIRSTVPDVAGKFVLAYVPEGTYDLVITSDGRATIVVTGVPVTTAAGRTTVTSVASPFVPMASAMSEVVGTTTVAGTTTLVTDATVTASQVLTGGPTVFIAGTPVDADLATYRLRLPVAAPMRAAYSVGGFALAADAAVAGDYILRATAPGRTAVQQAVDVSAGGSFTVNMQFAP
jgi:hypothetical protein